MSICLPRICCSVVTYLSYGPHRLRSCAAVSFAEWKETMWHAAAGRVVARFNYRVILGGRYFASSRARGKASAKGAATPAGAKEVSAVVSSKGASKKLGPERVPTGVNTEGIVEGAARRRVNRKERTKATLKVMDDNSFYVVRKGGIIGVYKSLADCQAQVSSSVGDPSVGVYKGYSLPKQTEEYLASHGLRNALYCIDAADFKEDLFGTIIPCPFEEPDRHLQSNEKASAPIFPLKRTIDMLDVSSGKKLYGSLATSLDVPMKQPKRENSSCIIEFDGASKGNPGNAGAGVVLKREDGTIISKLQQGLGVVTNNVAEYRALLLGMNCALGKGFGKILAQGDSKLVCSQVVGTYKTTNPTMAELCKQVRELQKNFISFQICHVKREFNSAADALANLAVNLACDEVFEESADAV